MFQQITFTSALISFLFIAGIDGVVSFFPYFLEKSGIRPGSRMAVAVGAASVTICMGISLTVFFFGLSLIHYMGIEFGAVLIVCGVVSVTAGLEPFGLNPLRPFKVEKAPTAEEAEATRQAYLDSEEKLVAHYRIVFEAETSVVQLRQAFLAVDQENTDELVNAHILLEKAEGELEEARMRLALLEQRVRDERLAALKELPQGQSRTLLELEQPIRKVQWSAVMRTALFPIAYPLLSGPALVSWILVNREYRPLPTVLMIGFAVVFLIMLLVIGLENKLGETRGMRAVRSFLTKFGGIIFVLFGIAGFVAGIQELLL